MLLPPSYRWLLIVPLVAAVAGEATAENGASVAPASTNAAQDAPEGVKTTSEVGVHGAFRCPGDDPGFWMDMKETGWVGFGETWDLDTCSEGVSVYAKGANRKWPDMRPRLANPGVRKLKPLMSDAEIHYYTNILPYMATGALGLAFLIAWALTFLDRFKKRTVRLVACESCGTRTPIEQFEGGVFCPKCGAGVPWAEDAPRTPEGSDEGHDLS